MSISFCFLERFLGAFLSRFSRFFNGFGALIFSPVERVAKVAIPRSNPYGLLVIWQSFGTNLDNETKKVSIRCIFNHGDARRFRG
jgi:hypothetical protein